MEDGTRSEKERKDAPRWKEKRSGGRRSGEGRRRIEKWEQKERERKNRTRDRRTETGREVNDYVARVR